MTSCNTESGGASFSFLNGEHLYDGLLWLWRELMSVRSEWDWKFEQKACITNWRCELLIEGGIRRQEGLLSKDICVSAASVLMHFFWSLWKCSSNLLECHFNLRNVLKGIFHQFCYDLSICQNEMHINSCGAAKISWSTENESSDYSDNGWYTSVISVIFQVEVQNTLWLQLL